MFASLNEIILGKKIKRPVLTIERDFPRLEQTDLVIIRLPKLSLINETLAPARFLGLVITNFCIYVDQNGNRHLIGAEGQAVAT